MKRTNIINILECDNDKHFDLIGFPIQIELLRYNRYHEKDKYIAGQSYLRTIELKINIWYVIISVR